MSHIRIPTLLLSAGLLFAGCADSDQDPQQGQGGNAAPTPSAGADSPEPAPIDSASPSYEVPVPDALADYAHYAIGDVEWRVHGSERRLEYTLPAELIGADQRIDLRGPDTGDSSWTLSGDKFGTAECQAMQGQIVCNEALAGIPIDMDAVAAQVQAGRLPAERLEVSKVFSGDPIGILRFAAP